MEFSKLGFIGKLFESDWLDQLVTYSSLFYRDKPIDWIYWSFINMKVSSTKNIFGKCLITSLVHIRIHYVTIGVVIKISV